MSDRKNIQDLLTRARTYLPGGSLGMFRLDEDVDTVFVRGEGSRLFDAAGRTYLDFVMGSGPMILGHAHPAVTRAIQDRAASGTTFYGLNDAAVALAERISKAAPCGGPVRFTSSGTDATFGALRLARAFTGRSRVLKFDGGWHGAHDYAQAGLSSSGRLTALSGGIPRPVTDTLVVTPFNDAEAAVSAITRHADDLAAVIVEPLQRAIPPEPGFLDALREATERHGVVLIFDEVVTGFRLAWGGAQERYGIVADLVAYGKTISGGLPLAAICGREDIMACADTSRKGGTDFAFISGTFNGNPLGAAAGLATLEELGRPGVYDRLDEIGSRIRTGLEARAKHTDLPFQVIGDGPVLQPFFSDRPIRNHADGLAADADAAVQFGTELVREGIFITPGGKIYVSLAHTDEDIDQFLEAAGRALNRVRPSPAVSP